MSESKLTYLGPLEGPKAPPKKSLTTALMKRVSLPFIGIVVVPTLVASVYYLGIASPRYVAEARFVVRSAGQDQPSAMGVTLQSVGIPSASTDSFAVHDYVRSKDGLKALLTKLDVRSMYSGSKIDPLSRAIRPWQGKGTFDDFYDGFNRYVKVGYDSTTGISTLRVQAFTPADAQNVSSGLLLEGEKLVNRLNTRSAANAVKEAEQSVQEAVARATQAQAAVTAFRNREGTVDPGQAAKVSAEMVGKLNLRIAELRAERAQIASQAPQSPKLPEIDASIRALEAQVQAENSRQTGENSSLAPKLGTYESLLLEREMADKNLGLANTLLEGARQEQRKQALYLERIVEPSIAERADEPKRLRSILTVFLSCFAIFGTIWLISAGLRESKQGDA